MEIILAPDSRLRQSSATVRLDELSDILSDIDVMKHLTSKLNAAGLAAPQIGVMKRIIVIREIDKYNVYINPIITARGTQKTKVREGCLSIPFTAGSLERCEMVSIGALDVDGNKIEKLLVGVPSYAAQHEIDHLDGILFYDLMSPAERASVQRTIKNRKKNRRHRR